MSTSEPKAAEGILEVPVSDDSMEVDSGRSNHHRAAGVVPPAATDAQSSNLRVPAMAL
jgi:hypothetical protein